MILENREITAVIFDMDGTMFDTERLRMQTLKEASLEQYGKSIPDKLLLDSLGLSSVSAERLAKDEFGEDYPYKEIRKRADELEMSYVKEHGVPIKKGLIEVLERLKRNELLLAVATSSKKQIALEYLSDADILKYFDIIVCGDEVSLGKPNPEIFLKAAEGINCQPETCLIFEDSENGLLAASAAKGLPVYIKDIKDARPEIKKKAFLCYDTMLEFLDYLRLYTKKFSFPSLYEHFPQNNNQRIAGIHGFGAIGGGYIAQVFSHWDGYSRPGKIIGATRNKELRNIVNAFHSYQVNYESLAYEQTIRNVSLIDIDKEEDMVSMYLEADIIALCIPENAFKQQAYMIAKGLLERKKRKKGKLTLLIVLNKVKAATFVKNQVKKALSELVDEDMIGEIIKDNYFCETVVNRMVSAIPKEELLKQIQKKLSSLSDSVTDTSNIKKTGISLNGITRILKNISDIQNQLSRVSLVLFSSEPDMTLYADGHSPLLEHFRQIKHVNDISQMQMIKNRLSNGTHAMIAWYSAYLGYESIGQGMGDERILYFVNQLMENEIKPMLLKNCSEYKEYINGFMESFIKRCRFSFNDPVSRVGRDPIRKLQYNERILGTMAMIHSYGIKSPQLELGAALGFFYAISLKNPNDKESLLLKNLYDKLGCIEAVLAYDGTIEGKKCRFLDNHDNGVIQRISGYFKELIQNNPACGIVS